MKELLISNTYRDLFAAVGEYAAKIGLNAWVVGGAVRDFYLHRPTQDIDLTFNGNQESVSVFCVKQWGGEKHKFSKFGTFNLSLQNGVKLDLARLRGETYVHPGALPVVCFTQDIKTDLFRRDFTINAWAVSISPDSFGKSADPYGARNDIDKKIIRVLHEKSFLDDPTRMLRAVRFAGRFGYRLAPKTDRLLREAVAKEYPLLISRERFSRELLKILQEENIKPIFELMREYDLLKFVYPAFAWQDTLLATQDVASRLGLLVLSLGANGEKFLRSLRVSKPLAHDISGAWRVYQQAQSPLHALTDFQTQLLKSFCPTLPELATAGCVVGGKDLHQLGLRGRDITDVLARVRRAQWEGKVTTRAGALEIAQKAL